ncbi:MAG: arylsulfatase [Saprospiraceae bacterium]|nr:arylsulfatase [Saprospiraceae bacterium]
MNFEFHLLLICLLSMNCQNQPIKEPTKNPNIIYILADDLGIGDLSVYNSDSKIQTPAIDALAKEGMLFSDAHSGSSVCTPTRYGILTGRYAWRTRLEKGVTWTYDAHLIDPNRLTVASLLKKNGYQTACIGKWHLGLDWGKDAQGEYDFRKPIANGPTKNGFDYFYGITASLDIPPYFYIENDRITATSIDTIEAMGGKKFWRKSVIGNDFVHEEVLPVLTRKAVQYIEKSSQTTEPFFLYFPLTAPHTPILPTVDFQGKSGTSEYGDFVLMVDDVVSQIVQAVSTAGIAENTLIIFTSDNGCSPMADFAELESYGHDPSYIYRGHKADIYEGGHRIPFIAKWPSKIKPGSSTDQTICLTDLISTVASIVHDTLSSEAGEDSYDIAPLFVNDRRSTDIREATVHHSIEGCFSLRQGPWKICFCPGSGGWSYPTPKETSTLDLPSTQLFNLDDDPAEEQNIATANPDVVKRLTGLMQQYIKEGRSTPGVGQKNDREVIL